MNSYLSYPLDAETILKKKRSIRKELLADGSERMPLRVAILGGSTTTLVKDMLELFLLDNGIAPSFYESEYNKWYEDGVFGNPALDEFRPQAVIVYTSVWNLNLPTVARKSPEESTFPGKSTSSEDRTSSGGTSFSEDRTSSGGSISSEGHVGLAEQEAALFEQVWKGLMERYHCTIIQSNSELPSVHNFGSFDAESPFGTTRYVMEVNRLMAELAVGYPDVHLFDRMSLSAKLGQKRWSDPDFYYLYKSAEKFEAVPEIAYEIAHILLAAYGRSRKCLVLDLDNTLWGGIVSEDGVDGLELGHETALGESYLAFQRYLLRLKERGVILAVVSKNDESEALAGLSHPDSLLHENDFASFIADWNPKSDNIRKTADFLRIGTDSLVFIDDNPAEREIVREQVPETAVPEVTGGEPATYIQALEEGHYFETISLSSDDRKRSEMYQMNRSRQKLEQTSSSYSDYLKALDMEAEIAPFREVYLDRIAQLTNKSNQFNLTTKRFTREEISKMTSDPTYVTLYGRLKDRFGDNGLVSVVIGHIEGRSLHIILWLMSCRVLKRDMEYAMLDALVEEAGRKGLTELFGYYYPTAKNAMVRNLYDDFGFEKVGEDEKGNKTYRLILTGSLKKAFGSDKEPSESSGPDDETKENATGKSLDASAGNSIAKRNHVIRIKTVETGET